MTKADIFSGFLGAGKTTLIKKLITEAYAGEKLVLIENEFGDIGIDGGFMQEAGIQVNEMNSGCICCSLVGDFHDALSQVLSQYQPDRILVEPSGVGKLSDILTAVASVEGIVINSATTVADAGKCKMYMKNFGEFYNDQIAHAGAIVLSRTDGISEEKLNACVELLREHNGEAVIITTPWDQLDGKAIQQAVERTHTLAHELEALEEHAHEHHHHHHYEHGENCTCGCHDHDHEHHHHHHEHGEDCTCGCHDHDHHHEHHHHEHDEHCECHEHHHDHEHEHEHEHHHHHHEHDEHCTCGCHDHDHHHADEIFTSWGVETPRKYSESELKEILAALDNEALYGAVLRAKGIVDSVDGPWFHFDHVPGEADVRRGAAGVTGRLCVIGADLNTEALKALFKV